MRLMKMINGLVATTLLAISSGCQGVAPQSESDEIYVSIAPLRMIVEGITGDDFPIKVVVPSGASVESYEPTPKQIIAINGAQMLFSTGLLTFEESILKRIENQTKITNLSRGVELIAGVCNHAHSHTDHSHGVDPHIWTSPRELKIMARNCFDAVIAKYPDSIRYRANYLKLDEALTDLDRECEAKISQSGVKSIFIYHPALTYYARAYGLEQVAIEQEGKEPSAKHLSELIEKARREGVRQMLYQREYPVSSVEIVAKDINAECVEIDPLSPDAIDQITFVTNKISE